MPETEEVLPIDQRFEAGKSYECLEWSGELFNAGEIYECSKDGVLIARDNGPVQMFNWKNSPYIFKEAEVIAQYEKGEYLKSQAT